MKHGRFFKRITALTSAAAITLGTLSTAPAVPDVIAAASDPDNYAKLLQYSLYFYDANMCGEISSKTGLSWRGNCHTSDEVTGGFHDAGDHAMFGLPQGYTASTLGWSYFEFKDAFDSTGQTEHLKLITDHFCDFFKKSTVLNGDTVTNFLYQKGDGNVDHDYWGPPENQTGSRQMFWTNNGASDIAAEYAAALAANYINFGNAEDLKYAEALYRFSTQYNQVATYGCSDFYNSSGCRDDQAWAAGWLYLATNKEQYKNDCASKQTQYLGWIHGWDNVDMGAACLYSRITGNWSKPNDWMSGRTNSSGYFFLDKWGSARLNCSMQMSALVAQKHSGRNYSNWCKGQMNYILGDNPKNTCFVVGYAPNSASKPHHRACSGTSSDKDDSPSKYVLVGALVGGPSDANGTYQDSRADYICNEVACDYNAALVGAVAGLYSTYKTGSTVSSIEGVTKIYGNGTTDPIVTTTTVSGVTTTTASTSKPATTTTTTAKKENADEYELTPNLSSGSMSSNFPEWLWSEFGIPENETAYKVEVTISSDSIIGTWNGAFGSTINEGDWYQSENFNEYFNSNTATAVWNIDADTSKAINYKYGTLKIGFWWLTNNNYTIDSIKVYTEKDSAPITTTTTKPTTTTTTFTTTTTKPTTTTTTSTTTTTKPTTTTTTSTTTTTKPTTTTTTSTTTTTKPTTTTTTSTTTTTKPTTTTTTSTTTTTKPTTTTTTSTTTTTKPTTTTTTSTTTTTKPTTTTTTSTTTTTTKPTTTTTTSTTTTTKPTTTTTTSTTTTTKPTTTTTTSTTTTTPAPAAVDGDANGDGLVLLSDAVLILQCIGNPDNYEIPESQLEAADVYERGSGLTSLDALTIQKFLLKMIVSLPTK